MASSALSGVRSPASPRSGATSPRPSKFDSDQLKTYIKKLLASTLQNVTWPEFKERERGRALMKEVGDRVKKGCWTRLTVSPKQIYVLTQVNENVGQGGRADVACHWEDSDAVVQEMLVTDSLICICIAFAVRTV
ncbi:hypothetical protein BJV77DRAFT_939774 [Russula vinacea]|nr:hypothetical protein BJV77DRAFT_939774 [Russula vinacea]